MDALAEGPRCALDSVVGVHLRHRALLPVYGWHVAGVEDEHGVLTGRGSRGEARSRLNPPNQ